MGRRRVKKRSTSHTPVSGAATRQVLGCYELLHHICSFMDISTLLHVQLVSQYWHDMISTSPLLQQNLYLKPRPSANPDQPRNFNPLLFKHFEPILKGRVSPYRWDGALSENILRISGMSITNMKDGRKIHKAFIRRGASWRRMLIAQPPITSMGYVSKVFSGRSDMMAGDWSSLSFPNGLRMGEFYDMVFQAIWGKPDDVVGYVNVEPGLNGFLDDTVQHMLYKWEKLPAFLIESEPILFADGGCGKGRCACRCKLGSSRDGRCQYLMWEKKHIRACKGTRWMFECEEFEEKDYLSPNQLHFTTR
ncbi:f-box protein [Fusarium langsethiae]|uniref:F-box protein n=1 Tax=Fusarium langsethiae TaxID=179993 RepID=A0A0M9EPU6_FUSLA|nr:f-box protein [Fusarium langsethiae]GKU06861.1 unnamed protein product [Fusarium langsethiae]GKU11630.1 unnamed protein product [Fusarium langsethiae]